MSFFLKDWRQIELRATVLIVVENAPSEISPLHFTDTASLVSAAIIVILVIERPRSFFCQQACYPRGRDGGGEQMFGPK